MLSLQASVDAVHNIYIFPLVRWWFAWPVFYTKKMWDLLPHTALDEQEWLSGIQVKPVVKYGDDDMERILVIEPEGVEDTREIKEVRLKMCPSPTSKGYPVPNADIGWTT